MQATELVDWFLRARQDPPKTALDNAALLMLDFVGNAVAGSTSELGEAIRNHVAETAAAGRAQVLGESELFAPGAAAMANATMASAFDFDEGYHVAAYTIAASLAVAQATGASGEELLRTVAAGYEAGEMLRRAADADRDQGGGITNSGWYHVGVVGPIIAALCSAQLLGLDRGRMANAVGIATDSSGGVREQFGQGAKQLQPGIAARAGVEAAQLARRGVTGADAALAGQLGIDRAFAWGASWDWGRFAAWSWETGALTKQLAIRRYPACAPGQPAVEAMLRLRERIGTAEILAIEAKPRPFSLRTPEAANESQLGFSLPYLLAVAARDGELGIRQLRWERASQGDVRELMARFADRTDGVAAVRVRLADGRELEETETDINYLKSVDEVRAKFESSLAIAGGADPEAVRAWFAGLGAAPAGVVPGL